MSAANLLGELGRHGVGVRVANGQLQVRDREGRFTPELRAAVVAHRAGLIQLLSRRGVPCSACGTHLFAVPTTCFWCRKRMTRQAA